MCRVWWLCALVVLQLGPAASQQDTPERSPSAVITSKPSFLDVAHVPADFDYSCQTDSDKKRNDFHLRGTALGGWLVLEPWLTPSLFYQFLGTSERWGDEARDHIAIDSYTFCKALGPEEANRQLRRHWASWVSEEQVANLAAIGVETLRIPVGDWMYKPYGPYVGCMDGALDELERVLRLCERHGMTAIIDIHAVRGSQNGLDNSGDTDSYKWIATADSPGGKARYRHWDIRGGSWAGHYNTSTFRYDSINASHIDFTLEVVRALVQHHKADPVVVGIEPVNEPWWVIPMDVLKQFYWESYSIVQAERPGWITLFHDSFRLSPGQWGGFMKGCDNWALDTHIYQAWSYPNTAESFKQAACADAWHLQLMENIDIPIIVGEWSLATDNCAMWLNGLNDNVPGYPKVECERITCPDPYMGEGQPGAPPDKTKGARDPFGTGGESYVVNGTCPRDRRFPEEIDVIRDLSYAKLNVFDQNTHGQFFWNFRTEFEPRWDYQAANKLGWIPGRGEWARDSVTQGLVRTACPWQPKESRTLAPAAEPTPQPSPQPSQFVASFPALYLTLPDINEVRALTANIWTGILAAFVVAWILVCCRRTQSLRGYMRVPEPGDEVPRGARVALTGTKGTGGGRAGDLGLTIDTSAVVGGGQGRKRPVVQAPVKYAVKDAFAV